MGIFAYFQLISMQDFLNVLSCIFLGGGDDYGKIHIGLGNNQGLVIPSKVLSLPVEYIVILLITYLILTLFISPLFTMLKRSEAVLTLKVCRNT